MPERRCALCDAPIIGRKGTAIYCGERCSRAVYNARTRGTEPRVRRGAFDCAECGACCVPGETVPGQASKFCSRRCKNRWHANGGMSSRRALAIRRTTSAVVTSGGVWAEGPCSECGARVVSRRNRGGRNAVNRYCSQRCSNRFAHRARRARLRGARTGEPVRFAAIAERDDWCCQLCGFPVNRDAKVPDFEAPVLDHIVALALGGAHAPSNVQLAHFLCNSYKGNRERELAA